MSGPFWHDASSGPVVTINFAICISPPQRYYSTINHQKTNPLNNPKFYNVFKNLNNRFNNNKINLSAMCPVQEIIK